MHYLLKSDRLGFRNWMESDRIPFREMNADQAVMEFFPKPMTHDEVDAMMGRMTKHMSDHGFGFYAVDLLDTGAFIGFIGIGFPRFELEFGRFLEIGWRTIPSSWGKGLATEGAKRLLDHTFKDLGFEEIYSMTSIQNKRSERVMQKLGMKHDRLFDMPLLKPDSHLLRHTLYKLTKQEYIQQQETLSSSGQLEEDT